MKNYIVKLKPFLFWIGFTLVGGLLSGLSTMGARDYYNQLAKPDWAPPGWLFGVVWPILYLMMGLAAYFVATSNCAGRKRSLTLYVIQLLMNFAWSPIFFTFKNQALALWWLAALLIVAIITANYFYQCKKLSGILMVPYLLWLIFALVLSISVYSMS